VLQVAAPHFDAAWEQHRLHALYTWIGAVVTAAAATLHAERIVRAGLARARTAVMDLDSLGALDLRSEWASRRAAESPESRPRPGP